LARVTGCVGGLLVKAVEQFRSALDAIGFEHPDWS